MFLDVAQAFDKVWHEGLVYKLSTLLPGNICRLLESYLTNRKYRVANEEARSDFFPIIAGVPQGSVLGPTLYLLYTADIPVDNNATIATYADDTVLMTVSKSQEAATKKLQIVLNRVTEWMKNWKIKLNQQKSVHVTFTSRRVDENECIYKVSQTTRTSLLK